MRAWTRNEKLTLWGAVVATLALLGAFFVPEVRSTFRLDEPSRNAQPISPRPDITAPVSSDPGTQTHGRADTAKDVAELRRRNQVTRIEETETGETVSELPSGIFGFADPPDLVIDSPEQVQLEPYGTSVRIEIHKLNDHSAEFVGYAGPETLERLRQGLAPGEKAIIYSDQWKEASNVVAIPFRSIKCIRARQVETKETTGTHIHFLYAVDCQGE